MAGRSYGTGERVTIASSSVWADFPFVDSRGQLYERTGKRDQAINEYQEFLSHFQNSQTRPVQVGEARATLKRLMQ